MLAWYRKKAMLSTTWKAFIAFLGVLAFVVAGNNAVALLLWLGLKFAWWPLVAPSCLYTSNGLPAPPPQDYLINLIVFVPLSWLAWVFARRKQPSASSGERESNDAEAQTLKKQPSSRNAPYTIYVTAGTLALIFIIELLVAFWPKGGSKQVFNRTAQSRPRDEKAPVNPNTLESHELMSKSKAELGTAEDGLPPEKENRMRETLASQLSGVMQKQNTGIRVDVVGDAHDVLVFQMPSMNDESADQLIQEFRKGDANFWNGVRLLNYSQVVCSGDGYKRVVTRAEFLGYGKDYEEYKAAFLRGVGLIQGLPNESEPVKPRAAEPEPRSQAGIPTLSETLEWLSGASDKESADGNN